MMVVDTNRSAKIWDIQNLIENDRDIFLLRAWEFDCVTTDLIFVSDFNVNINFFSLFHFCF